MQRAETPEPRLTPHLPLFCFVQFLRDFDPVERVAMKPLVHGYHCHFF